MRTKRTLKPSLRNQLRLNNRLKLMIGVSALSLLFGIAIFLVINTGNNTRSNAETTGIQYTFKGSSSTAWTTASNWTPSSVPGSGDKVIIPIGKTCDCGSINVACADLTVNGTLNVNNAAKNLTTSGILSGAGSLTVTGTLNLNGSGSFSGIITNNGTMAIGGTYTIYGTLVNSASITSTGSLTFGNTGIYNHNKDGGVIPTATWNISSTCLVTGVTGAAGIGSLAGLTQTFGNFTWNCPNQNGDIGAIGPFTIVGTFNLQNTGTQEFKLYEGATSAATFTQSGGYFLLASEHHYDRTFNINGNFSISGGTFDMSNHLGNGSTVNSLLFVTGNYTVSGGTVKNSDNALAVIDVTGSLLLSGGTLDLTGFIGPTALNVAGNWNQTGGTFTQSSGMVTFDGTAAQNVTGSFSLAFNNLTINNTSSTQKIVLSKDVTINGYITFTDGIVDALTNYSGTPLLIFSTTGDVASSLPSDASHVIGPVKKTTNTSHEFTFPIGNITYYRPISINPSNNNSTIWTAQYFYATPTNPTSVLSGVDHISKCEYWTLDRGIGGSPASAKVGLTWNSQSGVAIPSDIIIAHYNGTAWESCVNGGTFNFTGNTTAGSIETSVNWNSFSPFTIGSKSNNNYLPVELTRFDATTNETSVKLKWTTVSETNNDYFSIERSNDGVTFTSIGIKDGAGNSNIQNAYQFSDSDPYSGSNFYRLKQVDLDGAYTYSKIIAVNLALTGYDIGTITAGPNPFTNDINVNYKSASDGLVELNLYDVSGRVVNTILAQVSGGLNTLSLNNNNDLPAGIYMLGLTSNNKTTPLIKMVKSE